MKPTFLNLRFLFLLAPVILFAFTSKPDRANFSGVWKLNESKSDLGQFANFATRTIKSAQANDSIHIERTAPSFNGDDFTSVETLTFDGKPSSSKLFGESTKKATVKWSDDGQSFTISYTMEFNFNGQTNEVTGTEQWKLSDGGKTLILDNQSSSSFGDLKTKGVYEKQ